MIGKRIACGFSHGGVISLDGRLYTWGIGSNYQLGHGDKMDQLKPKMIETLTDIE